MHKHRDEEHGVKVRDRRRRPDDQAPSEALDPVGDVVRLAGVAPPAAHEQTVTIIIEVKVKVKAISCIHGW